MREPPTRRRPDLRPQLLSALQQQLGEPLAVARGCVRKVPGSSFSREPRPLPEQGSRERNQEVA